MSDPSDNRLALVDYRTLSSRTADAGSNNIKDPFFEIEVSTAGTYKIEVGTFRETSFLFGGSSNAHLHRVEFGLQYRLNVSIPTHPVGGNLTDLTGRTVTIIGGEVGVGQVNTISSYDPGSKTYTFENNWTDNGGESPDTTSIFEVTYPIDPASGYNPNSIDRGVVDSYEVSLAEPPTGTVILDIIPQVTRSLNQDLRFNELFDFGVSEKKEVLAATTQAQFTIEQAGLSGEEWGVILDGVLIPFTPTGASLSPEDVATALSAVIPAGSFTTAKRTAPPYSLSICPRYSGKLSSGDWNVPREETCPRVVKGIIL